MSATADQIDVRACASMVMGVLADLQGYLTAAMNPDRIALADLDMEPMGWTKRVYSQRAFDIWRRQLELFPDDPLTLHHMAIMHHARAFDLEAGAKPADSDSDWKAAMVYWHRLHGADAFWDSLTAKVCAGRAQQEEDGIKKLRADFPQMIMAIHYDIALDKETREKRKSRAKFHIAMVHKAPFDAQHRAEAQRSAYNRYIMAVPDEVWQPNELREEVLAEGQKAIVEYLNFDPGCVPALEDALRLQRRVQRSRDTAWRAMSEGDPKRKALLLLEKKDAEAWCPFFNQLASVVEDLEEDVREDLARWYHGRGGDLHALDEHEKAIEFYERAVGVCRAEDDERKLHLKELVQTMAVVAREKAAKEDAGARAYCDKLRKRDDLTMIACWVLAQAYTRLSAFDIAVDLCDRGMKIEPDFDDLDADEWVKRLAEFKQELPLLKVMSVAKDAMHAGKPEAALQPLNEAAKLAQAAGKLRDLNSIYWLRAQAHLALDRIGEAKRDVDLFIGLLDDKSSRSDIEAGKKMREIVSAKEKMGNIKPFLEKAKQAMEAGHFKDALSPLNEAAKKAPRMGVVFFLRAQVLCTMGRIADAQRDVKTVADLAETDEDRKHVQGLNEMIAQAKEASVIKGLLDKARQAIEADRFKDALPLLDQAEKKAPRTSAIYFLRAQANIALGNIADAKRDAKKVADLAETAQDRELAKRLNEMINQRQSVATVKRLLDEAKYALENQRFSQAVKSLDEAADLAPDLFVVYFLRAQARMGSSDFVKAFEDVQKCEQMTESPEEKAAAKRLKQEMFGGNL